MGALELSDSLRKLGVAGNFEEDRLNERKVLDVREFRGTKGVVSGPGDRVLTFATHERSTTEQRRADL
jgi:hypothetical protein